MRPVTVFDAEVSPANAWPGKFEGEPHLSEIIYNSVQEGGYLDSCAEEGFGTYFKVDGHWSWPTDEDVFKDLTMAEIGILHMMAGAIVEINDSGFVSVFYYRKDSALDTAWERIEKAFAEFCDELSVEDEN